MGIRDRLEKLKGAQRLNRPHPPMITQLEGQTIAEAHQLSESRNVPLESCRVVTEARWRVLHARLWGDGCDKYLGNFGEYYANQHISKVRVEQAAIRALIEQEAAHGNS